MEVGSVSPARNVFLSLLLFALCLCPGLYTAEAGSIPNQHADAKPILQRRLVGSDSLKPSQSKIQERHSRKLDLLCGYGYHESDGYCCPNGYEYKSDGICEKKSSKTNVVGIVLGVIFSVLFIVGIVVIVCVCARYQRKRKMEAHLTGVPGVPTQGGWVSKDQPPPIVVQPGAGGVPTYGQQPVYH